MIQMERNVIQKIVYEDNNITKVLKGEILKEDEFTLTVKAIGTNAIIVIGKRSLIKISGGVSVMGLIEKYNSEGLCQEEYCNNPYTHSEWFEVDGFKFLVLFCEKHWNDFINRYLEAKHD